VTEFTYVKYNGQYGKEGFGRIRGEFNPSHKFQSFSVFNPITRLKMEVPALHIKVLTLKESTEILKQEESKLDERQKERNLKFLEKERKQKEYQKELHLKFLEKKGIKVDPNIEYSCVQKLFNKNHRNSVCYQCHSTVDNIDHFECVLCDWIICPSCGACGCGYQ
jgi:hypothetical protein